MTIDVDPSRNYAKNGYYMLRYRSTGPGTLGTASQTVMLNRGTYTFSVFMRMKSFNINTFDCDANIKLIVQNASGTTIAESASQTMATERLVNWTEFQRISVTFTVATDNMPYTLVIHAQDPLDDNDGVWIDDAALTMGDGADNYSFVSNGDFELGATDWSGGTIVTDALSGNSALALTGSANAEVNAVHTVYEMTDPWLLDQINGDWYANDYKPEYYIFSAWAKANAVPNRDGRFFGIRLDISYAYAVDGVTGVSVEIPFRTDTEDWQLFSAGVRTHATAVISKITITLVYDYQLGTAIFDRVNLFRDSDALTLIEYNTDGYAKTVQTSDGGVTTYTYHQSASDKVLSETYTKGDISQTTTYTYNSTSNPQYVTGASVTAGGQTISQSTDRNSGGQVGNATVTGTTTDENGNTISEQAYSGATYSSASGQIGKPLTYTDANGDTTLYFYNANGRLEYLIDPSGYGLYYTYNKDGSLAAVQPAQYNATAEVCSLIPSSSTVSYSYNDAGLLSRLETSSTTYVFSYDSYGNLFTVMIGGMLLAMYHYGPNNGKLMSMFYGGITLQYEYDDLGRISYIRHDGMIGTSYAYNHAGQLTEVIDYDALLRHGYVYGTEGKCTNYTLDDITLHADGSLNTAELRYSVLYTYDESGRLLKKNYGFAEQRGIQVDQYSYYYNDAGQITQYQRGFYSPSPATLEYAYTPGGSIKSETLNMSDYHKYIRSYEYLQLFDGSTTYTGSQVTTYTETICGVTTYWYYTYDARGNITRIERQIAGGECTVAYEYTYDHFGQLTGAVDHLGGNSYGYTYDNAGNITGQDVDLANGTLDYWRHDYSPGAWGDVLIGFYGKDITYDWYGKPLSWKGYTLSWNAANRLASVTASGKTYSYTYDVDGLRLTASDGTTKHIYTYDGTQLVREELRTASGNLPIAYLYYLYGADGTAYGYIYKTADDSYVELLYYRRNLQGDVVGILNSSGVELVSYTYSPYGLLIETTYTTDAALTVNARTAVDANSLRYRGYCYDAGTGFYYLQSRYYDPQVARFISPDDIDYLGADSSPLSCNLFAYCMNNPVNMFDSSGNWPKWATKLAIGVGAIVIGAVAVAATAATGGAAAAFVGAAVAGLKAAAVSGAIGGVVGAGMSAVNHRVSTGCWSGAGKATVDSAVDGFANGFMTGGIMAGGSQILSSVFKVLANTGVPTGRNGGLTMGNKVRVLSPNHPKAHEAGGTLLKIGTKYKNIRFDVGSNSMFHMNIQLAKTANYHFPIGILGSGLWGGITRD